MTAISNQQIPFRKTDIGKRWKLVMQKYHRLRREVYQRLTCRAREPRHILFIVGCQRSGTTLLGEVLSKDLRSAVLQEQSCITGDGTLRLRPYVDVSRVLNSLRAPFIVAKPLVESQWTPELLSAIGGSRALWMYRDFQDVVRSNVKRFSSQIAGLRCAVSGEPRSWRNERISAETREILIRFFREDMRREDAAALGWYSRNVLYFELGLDARDDVMLFKYEDLVGSPERAVGRIYRFVGLRPPARRITADVDARSLGLGREVEIDDRIRKLCDELLRRLDDCYSHNRLAQSCTHESQLSDGTSYAAQPRLPQTTATLERP